MWALRRAVKIMQGGHKVGEKIMSSPGFSRAIIITARQNGNARAALATAIPSVRPSVCSSICLSHAGIVSKQLQVARCSLHCQIAKCVKFCRNQKNIPQGRPLPHEILVETDLHPPNSSKSWHVLPCSASTAWASEISSIMANRKSYTGFPTSHQPRFYATANFLKMGINYLNLSSFGQFWQ